MTLPIFMAILMPVGDVVDGGTSCEPIQQSWVISSPTQELPAHGRIFKHSERSDWVWRGEPIPTLCATPESKSGHQWLVGSEGTRLGAVQGDDSILRVPSTLRAVRRVLPEPIEFPEPFDWNQLLVKEYRLMPSPKYATADIQDWVHVVTHFNGSEYGPSLQTLIANESQGVELSESARRSVSTLRGCPEPEHAYPNLSHWEASGCNSTIDASLIPNLTVLLANGSTLELVGEFDKLKTLHVHASQVDVRRFRAPNLSTLGQIATAYQGVADVPESAERIGLEDYLGDLEERLGSVSATIADPIIRLYPERPRPCGVEVDPQWVKQLLELLKRARPFGFNEPISMCPCTDMLINSSKLGGNLEFRLVKDESSSDYRVDIYDTWASVEDVGLHLPPDATEFIESIGKGCNMQCACD